MSELRHLSPADLVIGENIRAGAEAPRDLVASIRARGVLLPIRAFEDVGGQIIVIDGQLRTLAAREAGAETVPVMVTETPDDADRLVDQWITNERRTGLTNRQRVEAVEQMALVGLSEAQIAKRTGTKRPEVAAALAASKTTAGKEFADQLTLEQAAVIGEFDDDPEAVQALTEAAERGQFDHKLSRLRQARETAAKLAELAAELQTQGVTVVEDVDRGRWLSNLTDSEDRAPLTVAGHVKCQGHAAAVNEVHRWRYINSDGEVVDDDVVDQMCEAETEKRYAAWEGAGSVPQDEPDAAFAQDLGFARDYCGRATAIWVCTDTTKHSPRHQPASKPAAADMTNEQREAASAERKRVIENNAAWRAAEPVRRAWLAEFAGRKTAPAGAEQFVARSIVAHPERSWTALGICELTGEKLIAELATCTPKRATQIALVVALLAWEAGTSVDTWRSPRQRDIETLAALQGWGYTLSEVEASII